MRADEMEPEFAYTVHSDHPGQAMKFSYLLLFLCITYAGYAQADVYKRVDKDGNVTYSNVPIKGGKKIELQELQTMQPFKEDKADHDKVDKNTQKDRDAERRKILEDELAAEEKLLAEARQKLQDAQDNPQVSHVNGKSFRNVTGQEEAIKNAQDQVTLHEKNVEALKQELAQLK
jgi:hypothetical protein